MRLKQVRPAGPEFVPHDLLDFVGTGGCQRFFGDFPRFARLDLREYHTNPGDHRRRHTQVRGAQSGQQHGLSWRRRHFATYNHGNPGAGARFERAFNAVEHGRM